MLVNIPVQTVIDRSEHLDQFMVKTFVTDNAGNVIDVLEQPIGGAHGMLPDDPAWYEPRRRSRFGGCYARSLRATR